MPKFPDSLSWSQEPGRVDIIWAQLPGPQQGAWKLGAAWPEPELSKHAGSLLQGCDSEPEQGGRSLGVGKHPKCQLSSPGPSWTRSWLRELCASRMVALVVAGLQVISSLNTCWDKENPCVKKSHFCSKSLCQKIPFLFRTIMFQEPWEQKFIRISKYSLGYVQLSQKSNLKDIQIKVGI